MTIQSPESTLIDGQTKKIRGMRKGVVLKVEIMGENEQEMREEGLGRQTGRERENDLKGKDKIRYGR